MAVDLSGTVLGERYRVLHLIGDGGMGRVYAAEHVTLRRRVAVKVLREELSRDEANVDRFLQEAQAATAVNHENVVDITDFGRTHDGSVFFVMEFLEGEELAALMHRQVQMAWPTAQQIIVQVVRGLAAAHERGVVHRDVKPANIFLARMPEGDTKVKLLDFGIAKLQRPGRRPLTGRASVFGTARYMSPEQAKGQEVDGRSDIYAVGVVLYEMLTGQAPFESDNFMEVVNKHINDPIVPPRQVAPNAGIPEAVEDLLMRALAKDPAARYQDMREFEAAILSSSFESTVCTANPLMADNLDQTIVWDAERGRRAREAAGIDRVAAPVVPPVHAQAPDAIDATVIRPRPVLGGGGARVVRQPTSSHAAVPSSVPVAAPRPTQAAVPRAIPMAPTAEHAVRSVNPYGSRQSSPFASVGVAHAPPSEPSMPPPPPSMDAYEGVNTPTFPPSSRSSLGPQVRSGDAAFFAPSAVARAEGDGGQAAPVLPAGQAAPLMGEAPNAHQTLPPVNWVGGANPITGEHKGGAEGVETAEFALNVPKHSASRNLVVILIAAISVVLIAGGLTAWALFFNDDTEVEEDIIPTVTQQQPRSVTPTIKPIDEKPKKQKVEPVEDDAEPEDPAPRVVAAAEPETEEPRSRRRGRRSRRSSGMARSGGGGGSSSSSSSRGRGSFNKARAAIMACGAQHGAIEGTVISVSFDITDGAATNVRVGKPHSVTSLGRCVANAVRNKARFGVQNAPGQTRRVQL